MSRMMQSVPTADVVVTNPTHFAVALRYRGDEMGAPKVIAKGQDLIAQRKQRLEDRLAVAAVLATGALVLVVAAMLIGVPLGLAAGQRDLFLAAASPLAENLTLSFAGGGAVVLGIPGRRVVDLWLLSECAVWLSCLSRWRAAE